MRKLIFIAAALALSACGKCDSPSPATSGKAAANQPAPEFHITKLLQADRPELKSIAELKGEVVVLEFWGSWCGPCVDNIPHFNELADKMQGKPVRFISVTDEKQETVENFLKSHPVKGWIGLDADKSTFQAFKVRGRPDTVVIDAKGVVVWRTYPSRLTEKKLEDVIAGKFVNSDVSNPPAEAAHETSAPAMLEVRISTPGAGAAGCSSRTGDGLLSGKNVSLRWMIGEAYGLPENRVIFENGIDGQIKFDIHVKVPYGKEAQLQPIARQAIELTLGLKTREEKRDMAVLVLKMDKSGMPGLKKSSPGGKIQCSSGPGEIEATGQEFPYIVETLEALVGIPIIDETGLKGMYDMTLKWDYSKKEALAQAMASQLGIKVIEAKRKIAMVTVTTEKPAGAAQAHTAQH